MERLAIVNGHVITMDANRTVREGATVLIDGSRISAVLLEGEPIPAGYQHFDATGCAVMPGLINAHTHLYSSLGRSLSFNEDLTAWLDTQKQFIAHFDDDDFEVCIDLGLAMNIRSGNTCVLDAMALPRASRHRYQKALDLAGRYEMSYILARAYSDQMVGEEYIEPLDEIERSLVDLIEQNHGGRDGRSRIQLFPNMAWALSREGFHMTRRIADAYGLGIQMHTAESTVYPELMLRAHGFRSDVQLCSETGCLGPEVQLLSCSHSVATDFDMIQAAGAYVILDPVSGTTLGSGFPPALEVMQRNLPLVVATNGMASAGGQDVFEAMKFLSCLLRTQTQNPVSVSAMQALEAATVNAAEALSLQDEIGSLEVGKRADVLCVKLDQAYQAPALDVVSTIVFSCSSRDVRDVFANGRLMVRDHALQTIDESALIEKANKHAKAVYSRIYG